MQTWTVCSLTCPCALPRHALVVFGGLEGLEAGVDVDPNLDVTDPSVLFDFYLNTCPSQGSRTIRTEVGLRVLGVPRAVLGVCLGSDRWPRCALTMAHPGSASGSAADLSVCAETTH